MIYTKQRLRIFDLRELVAGICAGAVANTRAASN
jgi:hypothetical protein